MIILANITETKFLNYLNSLNPHLKFIMETEMQGKLNLDVTICKQNNKIITSWHRMSTNTLNFTSWTTCGPKKTQN